eukprot:3209013-Amphidinium_carterae.1
MAEQQICTNPPALNGVRTGTGAGATAFKAAGIALSGPGPSVCQVVQHTRKVFNDIRSETAIGQLKRQFPCDLVQAVGARAELSQEVKNANIVTTHGEGYS